MDLADQIDDYICSFEGVGDLMMDNLAMLIFAWAVIALFLLWLSKFLYKKYVKKSEIQQLNTSTDSIAKVASSVNPTSKTLSTGGSVDSNDKLRKSEPRDILTKVKCYLFIKFYQILFF